VRAASVIVLTKFDKSDSTLRSIVAEILKQSANTAFYYKVGDEFKGGSMQIRENTDYGDGEVLFFVGSPAQHCESIAYSGDRLRSLGYVSLTQLRQIIRDSAEIEQR
jgi:hypothetical protein